MSIDAITITAALLGAGTFCILFLVYVDPRRATREGWHLWLMAASLGALAVFSLARRWIGEWPGYDEALSVLYAAIAVLLWQRVHLLVRARRDARKD